MNRENIIETTPMAKASPTIVISYAGGTELVRLRVSSCAHTVALKSSSASDVDESSSSTVIAMSKETVSPFFAWVPK